MKIINILTIITLITLASCQRKDDVAPDANNVTITITNPVEGQTYRRGDTVFMNASVQYLTELHGYELMITNNADSAVLYDEDEHVHDDHFTINSYWIDTLNQTANLTVKLTAEIDHDGHEASKTVGIKSQP